MSLNEEKSELIKSGQAIIGAIKALGRELNDEETAKLTSINEDIAKLDVRIAKAKSDEGLVKAFGEIGQSDEVVEVKNAASVAQVNEPAPAGSLGDHFFKSGAYEAVKSARGSMSPTFKVEAPDYDGAKAVGTFVTGGGAITGLTQTQYGGVTPTPLQRLTVADLIPNGQLDKTSLTYYVQTASATPSSGAGSVAEIGQKPETAFGFTPITETLHKIASWYAISDEAVEDVPYLKSVMDNQLLTRLALQEEYQLLNASGANADITGLLSRVTQSVSASAGSGTASAGLADLLALFRAQTLIQLSTFLPPDGLIVHPNDYQTMRLSQDANNQFYGGGPFTGAYGVGGVGNNDSFNGNPGIWSWKTVVTTAIPQGTALIGNFQLGAAIWRKGGVRVDMTNSDGTDFQLNIVKIRAEERLLLAVAQPNAFAKVILY